MLSWITQNKHLIQKSTMDTDPKLPWPAAVAQFTRAAALQPLPEKPTPLSRERVTWLCRMVMSELFELASTVAEPSEGMSQSIVALQILDEAMRGIDHGGDPYSADPAEQCAQQADAIVDLIYYSLNVAAAHSIDVEPVFRLVHAANMTKVDAATGIVRRGTDGKIQKPPGWQPPDVLSEIKRQIENSEQESKRQKK